MNIDLPPDLPPSPESPDDAFKRLLRQLRPQLEKVPQEMRVPPIPPNESAVEEVTTYLREKLKLPVAANVPYKILVAGELVEHAKIREGRLGEWDGLRVFAFFYRYEKQLRCVCIYPRDGVDVRMIAKAVTWGLLDEMPPSLAQSEISDMNRFFAIKCFKASRLYDEAALDKFRLLCQRKADEEVSSARSATDTSEKRVAALEGEMKVLQRRNEILTETIRRENCVAFWCGIGLMVTGTVALLAVVYILFGRN